MDSRLLQKAPKTPSQPAKRLARLTEEEDVYWVSRFEELLDQGLSDEDADAEVWEDIQEAFPRLKAFDGMLPTTDAIN